MIKDAVAVNEVSPGYVPGAAASKVPAGYKQTEVGVIPQDWCVRALGDLGDFHKGQGIKRSQAASGSIPCIRYGEIYTHHNDIVRSFISHISREVASTARQLHTGDILFAGSGETKAEIGKAVAFAGEGEAYAGGDIVILRQKSADATFLGYILNAPLVVRQKSSKGQGDAVVHISASALASVKIPIPPADEQRAIATALSDVDALLEELDRLIAKKRDLKQATMQQLLTGQTRLPGFEGEWVSTTLGEIASFYKGKGLPKSAINSHGQNACVHYGELFTKYGSTISETISRTDEFADAFLSVSNDVLMPTSDVTPKGLAKASCITLDNVVLGGDILIIRSNPRALNGTFLSLVIRMDEDQVLRLVTGTTVYHLYGSDMQKFQFSMPEIDEQNAIVEVLSNIDAEIVALEDRRNKTALIKQAMMQELLTGRIRLI